MNLIKPDKNYMDAMHVIFAKYPWTTKPIQELDNYDQPAMWAVNILAGSIFLAANVFASYITELEVAAQCVVA